MPKYSNQYLFELLTTGITCPKIDAPEYGVIEVDDLVYGSRVKYSCNHGYELYGDNFRTCGYNGKWSGKEPTCKRKSKVQTEYS